jgi:hypothetical protein
MPSGKENAIKWQHTNGKRLRKIDIRKYVRLKSIESVKFIESLVLWTFISPSLKPTYLLT